MADPIITPVKEKVTEQLTVFERYSRQAYELAVEYTPKLIIAVVVLLIGFWLIRQLGKIAERSMKRRDVDVSLRTFIRSLIGIGLKVILLITVAGMAGIQTTSLVTILGAAGLAIGLALQGSLSNFAGGVLVLVFKPYRVGDTIDVLGQKGEVREIQIFNTILLTGDHRTIILPNGSVSNSLIVNHSKQGTLRAAFDLTVSNEHDAERVRKIILEIVRTDKRVITYPAEPVVLTTTVVAGGYTLQTRFFTNEPDNAPALADIIEQVNRELQKRGIGQPTPRMVIYKD
jgi:small conductance mechanosensitive channel